MTVRRFAKRDGLLSLHFTYSTLDTRSPNSIHTICRMPRRPQPVPCQECIERASHTPAPLALCETCLAVLGRPNPSQFVASSTACSTKEQTSLPPACKGPLSPVTSDRGDSEGRQAQSDIEWLDETTRAIVDALNAREYTNAVFSLVEPMFTGEIEDTKPRTFTAADTIETFQKMDEESPQCYRRVERSAVEVDETVRHAQVFLTITVTGRPVGVRREILAVAGWRKDAEGWRVTSLKVMRAAVL
jgi:hypothetical protein